MAALRTYLEGLRAIHSTGEAVEETSYYGQLEALFNEVGRTLSPPVTCVLTTKNRGAGVPDGGLFVERPAVVDAGDSVLLGRAPERGVVEVKGPAQDIARVARFAQVKRYLQRYGKVLLCTYRDFLVLRLDSEGQAQVGERFTLAHNEASFRALDPGTAEESLGADFVDFLRRALLGDAPLSDPADLAWFLAAYARTGRERIESAGDMEGLAVLRSALEDALGLRFENEDGEHFFRSALVQTLFYGVFAAWVYWVEQQSVKPTTRFTWRQAQWTLSVPMVRVLFQQLATPAHLPVGLDEVLDWTDDVLARVDCELFFKKFEAAAAVQYFYEPFLHAYDPDLRREMGVWYTPPEVVEYMVDRVDDELRSKLQIPLGLADSRVHILDPCTGTGSYLTAVVRRISTILAEQSSDGLVAAEVKQAVLARIHGFELLPAPFVIAHLQLGLLLQRLGAPLSVAAGERASVYLTNALTGWLDGAEHPHLPFPEFAAEREGAESVKRENLILVVIGNPPYNGFAGVSGREEGDLIEPYKVGLSSTWDVSKNKLDDLYVRFFRIAERRIAEQTGRGIVCFVTNSSWLGDPSSVVMRERMLKEFDYVSIDNLNGDSRETGKKTPTGEADPSIFSTRLNPAGITRGVAISTLVRTSRHTSTGPTSVVYRDFWGADKREQLAAAVSVRGSEYEYEEIAPSQANWFRLLRWKARPGYSSWPAVNELCAENPMLGLNENRQLALIDGDAVALEARIRTYLDPNAPMTSVDPRLQRTFARFDPERVRDRLIQNRPFDEERIKRFQFRPLDYRHAYVETETQLWNESRPLLTAAAATDSGFLLVRRRAPRALDGATFHFSNCLLDQKVLFTDAYAIPLWLSRNDSTASEDELSLFSVSDSVTQPWRPNLSSETLTYLTQLGIADAATNQDSAALIWLHALAIGYSPLYVEQNGPAVRADWPRIPMPSSERALQVSASLGLLVSQLLDVDSPMVGVDKSPLPPHIQGVAVINRPDGRPLNPDVGDLSITAGWGIVQPRAIMPGSGKYVMRDRDKNDSADLTHEQRETLGEQLLDVYLNDHACWSGIPAAAWDYKVGGFQVLRKWLSYRERRALGRDLTTVEARTFTAIARRLTALSLLSPRLDVNYREIAESDQLAFSLG